MCVVLYKYLLLCWFPLSIRVWIITINGAEGTIYAGEKFRLRVAFPEDYPTKPPAVYFLQSPPPPKHQVGKRSPQPCSLKSFKVVYTCCGGDPSASPRHVRLLCSNKN